MQGERPNPDSIQPFRLKEEIEGMIKYGRPLTLNFSRKDKDLAIEMRETMLRMYKLSIELEKKYYRKTTAQELDVELESLRHLVRMASEKEYFGTKYAPPLSTHQYETWSRHNSTIGKMLGAYIKSLQKQQ